MGGGGQISPSPIDFHRRPYNTLALPCERVMKNDLCSISAINDFFKYADDTTLLVPQHTDVELDVEFQNV